jgi:hypothetical protein
MPVGRSLAHCGAASLLRRQYVRLIYRMHSRQQCVSAHEEKMRSDQDILSP